MNQNQPNLVPFYLITIGSGILAIPGALGTYFLIFVAFDSLTKKFDTLALFLPVAIVGYLLLLGYFWTAWNKKFVK